MRPVRYPRRRFAAWLAALAVVAAAPAVRACDKSPQSAWLIVGQSTKDFGGLQILLDSAVFNRVTADAYHISIKFNGKPATIAAQPAGPAMNVAISPDASIKVSVGQCGTVTIGASRATARNTVELHWSYF